MELREAMPWPWWKQTELPHRQPRRPTPLLPVRELWDQGAEEQLKAFQHAVHDTVHDTVVLADDARNASRHVESCCKCRGSSRSSSSIRQLATS